ncbi:MAG: arginine ABC transporter permease [Spirochaetaceae bacterium 4572_59]|nr:MAG: arginine ABC transporter permease [Spirochaetaceae bacterium 4572_59]
MDFSFIREYWSYFLLGTANTIVLAIFTLILGAIIGLVISLMRLSSRRILSWPARAYISVIRGTPLLVQIFIIYYGLPFNFPQAMFLGVDLARFVPGIIALSINSGAYIAEIVRAGIQAVDKGQMEASRSIGFNHAESMKLIILPQAIKNILPALGNEFVIVIKESSIVSVIGIAELMYNAGIVRGATYRPMEPLLIAAFIYFILTSTITRILGQAERRMSQGD